jgi:hypothetical protein
MLILMATDTGLHNSTKAVAYVARPKLRTISLVENTEPIMVMWKGSGLGTGMATTTTIQNTWVLSV